VAEFLCKLCGAASPAGIGYVGEPERDYPAVGCPNPHVATMPPLRPYREQPTRAQDARWRVLADADQATS
jgi:hypothetical protein